MISGAGAVCRETRKAHFSRHSFPHAVHDWREKCRLTQYHGKLTHYRQKARAEYSGGLQSGVKFRRAAA